MAALSDEPRQRTQAEAITGAVSTAVVSKAEALRAFAVTFGGPAVLDIAATAALGSSARSFVHGRVPQKRALAGCALTAAYALAARPWMAARHEIDIDAAAEDVWPWIAQLGQDRAGFYSHTWLENLAGCRMPHADRIHPEWQNREIGETVPLHPAYGLPVARFEPDRVLELKGWGTFEVERLAPGRSRLSCHGEEPHGAARVFYTLLLELPHYLMERKMLTEIKRLAESNRSA